MSPSEDAALLLVTVRRHLRSLALTTDPAFPQEDWGVLAQQALEKVLKAGIVLLDQEPSLIHEPPPLAALAGMELSPVLLGLQLFAVKACYSAEDTPLPGDRLLLLRKIEELTNALEARLDP
jgi:hypothetical protein